MYEISHYTKASYIIVLLILAGVTIATLTGDNGNEKLILMRS